MIVLICLFSGLANYSTQTLATFMLPITYFSVCKSYPGFAGLSIPSASIARTVLLLCFSTTFYSSNLGFKLL